MKRRLKGFALAEIMIAVVIITLAILLVGELSQQVLNMSKAAKQVSAVLELRSKINSITKNPVPWLAQMKSSPVIGGIYTRCISDDTTTFNCPALKDNLLSSDSELASIAGVGGTVPLHITDAPLVDALGVLIAGTLTNPLYLDSEGRACASLNPSSTCPLKSTGYFLRSNAALDQNPGNIKFIAKIEKNFGSLKVTGNSPPMKAQYLSMDLGQSWNTRNIQVSNSMTSTGSAQQLNGIVVPTCSDSQNLSYDGNQFQCKDATVASASQLCNAIGGSWNASNNPPCKLETPSNKLTCSKPLTLYVCNNGGAMGTSPNFCEYMHWGLSSTITVCEESSTAPPLVACSNGAMGTTETFCNDMNWGTGTPINLRAPASVGDCKSPMTLYVCSNGGAMGTNAAFCEYMKWGPANKVTYCASSEGNGCKNQQALYACSNGGALSTSPQFCNSMNWGPAQAITLCDP